MELILDLLFIASILILGVAVYWFIFLIIIMIRDL